MSFCRLNRQRSPLCSGLRSSARWLLLWTGYILLLCAVQAATAETQTATASQPSPVDQAELATARKSLEADTSLSDPQKQDALDLYDQIQDGLRDYQQAESELQTLRARIADAPERIKQLREISDQSPAKVIEISTEASLGRLQLDLSQAQANLDQTQSRLEQQQKLLSRLQIGALGIGEKITELSKHVATIDTELETPVTNEPTALTQARTLKLRTQQLQYQVELEIAKQEIGHLDLLTELAQAELDQLTAEIGQRRLSIEKLQQATQLRQAASAQDAVQQAEEMRAQSAGLPNPLREMAANSTKFRQERADLIRKEKQLAASLQKIRQQGKELQADFIHSQDRVNAVGSTRAIGRMLKRRKAELPLLRSFPQVSRQRVTAIEQATERQIDIEDLLRPLSDLEQSQQRIITEIASQSTILFPQQLQRQTRELLLANKNALVTLRAEYSVYISQLVQQQVAEKELAGEAESYAAFIDKQLIWIPNSGLAPLLNPMTWVGVLAWISRPEHWQTAGEQLVDFVKQRPGSILFLLGLVWFLVISRRHGQQQLQEIAHATRKIRSDNFLLTVRAFWITLAIAVPVPLLMIALSLGLLLDPGSAPFTRAIAGGILNLGIFLGVVKLLRTICRENGLGDSHLRWPQPLRDSLSRELRWMLPISLPLIFAVGASYAGNAPEAVQSVGQLAFIVLMLVLTTALIRFFRSDSPVIEYLREHKPRSWLVQLHFFWYPIAIMIPVVLGITAVLGYYYTAVQFGQRLRLTLWLFLALILARDLLLRWFYVEERRLRLADALKRRDEQRAAERDAEGSNEGCIDPVAPEEPEVDYNQLSEQSRRLVWVIFLFSGLFGAWSIWVDLLPNLRFLNQITLPFLVERVVDGVSRELPITLSDILTGLLLIMVTVLAAKNLPGLLEIAILRRLPITSGARYAISTLAQYTIVIIGIFLAFNSIGIKWSNIQWLVAALSVGVGFGLKEIFANFISGIILLFEQPIRVGDVVTVNNTIGTVSRFQMRATTIVNRDQQELIVPNKAFITSEVLNWTLSDNVNRRIITVGITYGSDVRLAMKLITEAAEEHPFVLDDPSPYTAFEEFGDNALILRLRAFLEINTMRERRQITSDLYEQIYQKLNDAKVVIAFPQLDVHLHRPSSTPGTSAPTR